MLDVKELSVRYGEQLALDRVTFRLESGQRCALLGANGAGKTSLLMAVVGVVPSTGSVTAGGVPLTDRAELRRKVGVVFQNPDDQLFLPTVYQDVAFGLENLGIGGAELRERVEDCLTRLGISQLRDRSALGLSGGEKRMAALATVLVMEPEVLLLDEPTAFLDPRARRRLMNTLESLEQTMLIATHDLSFAWAVCPQTVLLSAGRIAAQGPSRQLLPDREIMTQAGIEDIRTYYGGSL